MSVGHSGGYKTFNNWDFKCVG